MDKWLDLLSQKMVLLQDMYLQEGLNHQGLSGCQNKAAILYKSGCTNEKTACFPVLEVIIAAETSFFLINNMSKSS